MVGSPWMIHVIEMLDINVSPVISHTLSLTYSPSFSRPPQSIT